MWRATAPLFTEIACRLPTDLAKERSNRSRRASAGSGVQGAPFRNGPGGTQLHQTRNSVDNDLRASNSAASSGADSSIRCPSTSGAEL